ncbi:helix-turn-helix domain-containing protein [Glaesserella parasuis]|uniref:helix-turn-helix domain-containing protein n=1 Tax=Glaesserella parasuis TaxID=738 RepID=UPI002436FC0E|nr:helix-turn-helix domain-containing protein [Glaesserella parasuis]MDG6312383.1 helix-turn-helix domain-containing protein [Glaesserella parasuis]
MIIFSTAEIFQRLRKKTGLATNKELAELLEVNEKTMSGWINRNSLPMEVLILMAEKFNVSFDWLITGESKESKLETAERMLLTAFKDLDDNQKMQAVTFVGNLASGTYSSGQGVNQTAHGNGNNQQVFSGDVGEVTGIKK